MDCPTPVAAPYSPTSSTRRPPPLRILIVSGEPPVPPLNGQRLVVAALLPHLQARHDVRLVTLASPGDDALVRDPRVRRVPPASTPRALLELGRRLATGQPLRTTGRVSAIRRAVVDELTSFDPHLVHGFGPDLAPLHAHVGQRPFVLSALDASHLNVRARIATARGPRRLLLQSQERRIRREIRRTYPGLASVVVVSQEDADEIRRVAPRTDVIVLPNGVRAGAEPAVARREGRITVHGAMHWAPNVEAAVWAASEILPRVRRRRPETELVLVGRDPAPAVRALERHDGVTVTGAVDDVRPWLEETGAYLCPMRSGTGIKNKLLEAMAAAAPAVATPLALQGIAAEAGRDVLVGRTADELADQLVRLLDDPPFARELGSRGRDAVLSHHSWEAVADRLNALYEAVTAVG